MTKPIHYHMPQTRSQTVSWMNEELGDVCETRLINIREGEQKTPQYLAINPMGKVPALVHEDVVITEVAAICAYLADAFPGKALAPAANDPQRGAYYRWMFFAPSVIEPMMLDKLGGLTRENPASAGHGAEADVLSSLKVALAGGDHLLGDRFSTADVIFGSTLNFATMFGAIEKTELIGEYINRLTSRPAFVRAMEKNEADKKTLGLE